MGKGESLSLFICQPFHLRSWPEATWSYIVKEFKPSNSKITTDSDQDFCLPLYSNIYTWSYKQACKLFIKIRWSKRYHHLSEQHIHQITTQLNARSNSLNDIRVETQEDDELLYSSTLLHMDGQESSERFQAKPNHIGPSGKSWQCKRGLSWRACTLLFPTRNVKVHFTLYMKDILVLINVSLESRIQFIGQTWMTSLRN